MSVLEPTPSTTATRTECDSLGAIAVPAEHYWGAQTQRSLIHFAIGDERMPVAVIHAYALVKKAAGATNADAGRFDRRLADAIVAAAEEVIAGRLDAEFPLSVWQTGSGTQTNMNLNEVIANRANLSLGAELGANYPVHPNDHVNMSQSTNDGFVTAMHIATLVAVREHALPRIDALVATIRAKAAQWVDVIKIGRTHLQDATPITVGQEWSGWAAQLTDARDRLDQALESLCALAIGATAVGTGLNAPDRFGEDVAARLAASTGLPLRAAGNRFAALGSLDAMVAVSAGLRGVAVALMTLANDMRWLGSGPRTGLHELKLPANEPGSSIMPGKVNPTLQEAAVMVAHQVIGADAIVASAGAQGNFQLNTMRPIVIRNVLHSARILGDAAENLRRYSVQDTELDGDRIGEYVDRALMLVTALSPHIGYEKSAAIAHRAEREGSTLRDAALLLDVAPGDFDRIADPANMVGSPRRDLGIAEADGRSS